MSKQIQKARTVLYPLPVVMVTCGELGLDENIITIAWTGTLNSDPPMAYISVRPERHSYDIIKKHGEFVINLTTERLVSETDFCGVRSGRDINKFKALNLTPAAASVVKAPLIAESPVNIECVVKEIMPLGSHHMFISDVVAVSADDEYTDENGKFYFEKSNPICYSFKEYYSLGKKLGEFGFSIKE